ncbi:MAG: LCP family protein [Bacilli bacterium]
MKKRKLRLPFRILRTLSIVVIILIGTIFVAYKYFIEDDLNAIINAYETNIYNEELENNLNPRTDSYSIAILGVDEDLETSRTDSINLMVVNPKTNEMNLYSIPRDTYVQYNCINDYSDKITNANNYGGVECTLDALNNIFNIEVDFYIKLDFQGFLSIIDQLGTIETNIPDFYDGTPWCEQTSNRMDEICFSEFGAQEINSEQALAIARSRQHSSDLDRNNLQSQIISDTIKEVLKIRDLKKIEDIIYSVEGQVETNIDTKQAFYMTYNMYKFNKDEKAIQSYQLLGVAEYTTGDYSGYASYFILDTQELQKIREELDNFMNKEG